LIDFAGAIAELYAFDAYGNAIGFDPSVALTEFLYSGEQFDSKIGQQYLRQRYYDPATGRFNRLDPFFGDTEVPMSFHKYLYTHNDPIGGIDPSGETLTSALCVASVIGAVTGGIVGGIRNGVWGAVTGAFWGAVTAPLFALGVSGVGIGIAYVFGISTVAGLAISFGTAMTASIAYNIYELSLAKTTREKWAAGTSLVFTIGFGIYGGVKIAQMPKLPVNAKENLFSLFPNSKKEAGTLFSEIAALFRGEIVVAREVTIKTQSGIRFRIDLVVKTITGKLKFIESKFGKTADATSNQKIAHPEFIKTGGEVRGNNGLPAGLPNGTKLPPQELQYDLWQGAPAPKHMGQ
jgi:RHS repeat-associated protein